MRYTLKKSQVKIFILIMLNLFQHCFNAAAQEQQIGPPNGHMDVRGRMRIGDVDSGDQDDRILTISAANEVRAISGIPQTKILDRLCIYQENTEWATSTNTSHIDPASNNSPCDGNVNIEGTNVANNEWIKFTTSSPPNYFGFNYLTFKIRSKGTWTTGQRLRIRFLDSAGNIMGTQALLSHLGYGFNSSMTDTCQTIYIPLGAFGNITRATTLIMNGSIISSGTIGYYIDEICLLATSSTLVPPVTENQGLQGVMDVDPNLYHDNFSDMNGSSWTLDSGKMITMHLQDYLKVIGDVHDGRETIFRGYVSDNPYTFYYIGNATHINGKFSPIDGAYLSAYPYPVPDGVKGTRAVISPANDFEGADAFVNIAVAVAGDTTSANPLNPPLQKAYHKDALSVSGVSPGGFTEEYFRILHTGQIRLPQYPDSLFSGPAIAGLGLDAVGNVILTTNPSSLQSQLSGTGFVKASGTTISYDNSNYLTGNQSITWTASNDVSGSASGSTSISPSLTVTGLRGSALPSLSAGFLKYNGSAWTFDNSTYLTNITGLVTPGTNVTVTGSGTSGSPYVINSTSSGSSNVYTPLKKSSDTIYQYFNVLHYGAQSGNAVFNGAMTSGSATFTSATAGFTSNDVGKGFILNGAGTSGRDIVGTITAFTNSTTVTLSVTASTTVSGAKFIWGNDCTSAFQSAINAADAAYGGTVFVPTGIYMIAGALQTSVSGQNPNCQIYIPSHSYTDSLRNSIIIEGESPIIASATVDVLGNIAQKSGTWLVSTITGSGTAPAVIGGKGPSSAYGNFTTDNLYMENVGILVAYNTAGAGPTMGGINAKNIDAINLKNVYVGVNGDPSTSSAPTPTNEVAGIIFPQINNAVNQYGENCLVLGFRYGIVMGEHAVLEQCSVFSNFAGLVPIRTSHAARVERGCLQWNKYSIYIPHTTTLGITQGTSFLNLAQVDIEIVQGTSKWNEYAKILWDSLNYGRGTMYYHLLKEGVGTSNNVWWNRQGGDSIMAIATQTPQIINTPLTMSIAGSNTGGSIQQGGLIVGGATALTEINPGWRTTTGATLFELNTGQSTSNDTKFAAISGVSNQTGTSSNVVFGLYGTNAAVAGANKLLGMMEVVTDGATNSGKVRFKTTNAGTTSETMSIDKAGLVTIPQTLNVTTAAGIGSSLNTSSYKLDITHSGTFPKTMIAFRKPSSGDWGLTLGSETIPNVYIGAVDANPTTRYFWRGNYNNSGVAANTFSNIDNVNVGVVNITTGTGLTNPFLAITSNGGSYGDKLTVSSAGNFSLNTTSAVFRTTNGGSDINAKFVANTGGSVSTAGSKGFAFEDANGVVFQAANGTREIARAAINITNLTNTAGSEAADLSFYTQTGGAAIAENLRLKANGLLSQPGTNTASGTTGAQTINKPTGSVNFAAGATSLTVTNSLVTTSSLIFCQVMTNDATATSAQAVGGSGSFTITLNAAATAETKIAFWVINNY
jgi:hypothetical protein